MWFEGCEGEEAGLRYPGEDRFLGGEASIVFYRVETEEGEDGGEVAG